jgi:catechol 2,3-dioxygenase-like lactoylglutathione lyase family enzyme
LSSTPFISAWWSAFIVCLRGRQATRAAKGLRTQDLDTGKEDAMFEVYAIDHIVFTVADLEASARWYQQVLGMRCIETPQPSGKAARVSLRFGSQKINLRPASATQADWFTARHVAEGSADICFLVGVPPETVVAHLKACNVAIEQGSVTKHGAQGEIRSVYCRDPDGSLIEISSYPG